MSVGFIVRNARIVTARMAFVPFGEGICAELRLTLDFGDHDMPGYVLPIITGFINRDRPIGRRFADAIGANFSKMVGTCIRVEQSPEGAIRIGHILENRWFSLEEEMENLKKEGGAS